jgi:hypothetical protein
MVFESNKSLRAPIGFVFIIESVGLEVPLIHLISAISCLLYDWCIYIMSIISLFSTVVPSFTRYLYRECESVQRTNSTRSPRILSIVTLIDVPISNL